MADQLRIRRGESSRKSQVAPERVIASPNPRTYTPMVTNTPNKIPWYLDFSNLFIGAGAIGAVIFFWGMLGWAGIPLSDGEYSCTIDVAPGRGLGALYMHEATVRGGEVIDVRHGSFWDGESVRWANAERKDPNSFLVTIFEDASSSSRLKCTH